MSHLFPTYRQPRGGRKFLVKDVDMRYSFDTLKELALMKVGCDFEAGDICYFENTNHTRRKVLLMRDDIIYCLYWMKIKGGFVEIDAPNGLIKKYIDFNQ